MFHLQVIRSNRGSQWVLLSILYFYEFVLVFFFVFQDQYLYNLAFAGGTC